MNTERISCSIDLQAEQAEDGRQWVHLVPTGTFKGKDGRGPWTLTDANAVIDATRRHAGRNQIAVDYDHQTQRSATNGQPAPAAGWITGMQARRDGIWALVQWTAQAAAMLAKREYRYISPVFLSRKDNGQIAGIIGAGLTNSPNLDQLTAVANSQEPQDMEKQLEELKKLLGLDANSEMASVLAAVTALQTAASANAAEPDPAKFVPIGDFQQAVAEVNKLRQGITKAEAEAHVNTYIASGHIAPFMKEWAVNLCTVNMPAFDEFAKAVAPSFRHIVKSQLGGLGARPPGKPSNENLSEMEHQVCTNLGLTAEQFNKARDASTER